MSSPRMASATARLAQIPQIHRIFTCHAIKSLVNSAFVQWSQFQVCQILVRTPMMKCMIQLLAAGAVLLGGIAPQAQAGLVTYTWVTDSTSPTGGLVPSTATFQVDLAKVQTGTFGSSDIQNINFAFPGIGPLSFTSGSSDGSDNAAFVDTTTGLPTFHDANQGLAAIAYQNSLFSNTFLSITFDNPSGSSVGDEFNAINGGPGSLGFGNGHWTESGYVPSSGGGTVPEPSGITLLALGVISTIGYGWRCRRITA